MLRSATQKGLPGLWWPPLVVRPGKVRVQALAEVTSPGARGGKRSGLVDDGRAPIARLAVGRGS